MKAQQKRTFIILILLITLFWLVLPSSAMSAETGYKLGFLFDGEISMSAPYTAVGSDAGFIAGLYVDMPVSEKLMVGLHVDSYSPLSLTSIGAHIKPVIQMEGFQLRPYFGIGYGMMSTSIGASSHLLLEGGMEVTSKTLLSGQTVIGDFGMIMSPDGGVSGVADITFSPVFFLRAGVAF